MRARSGSALAVRPRWMMLMAGAALRLAVSSALSSDRFRLLTAGSPAELVRRLRIVLPDVVLLEIDGDNEDEGLAALRAIRVQQPYLPVYAILEPHRTTLAADARRHGATGILFQPLDVGRLLRALSAEIVEVYRIA